MDAMLGVEAEFTSSTSVHARRASEEPCKTKSKVTAVRLWVCGCEKSVATILRGGKVLKGSDV